VAKNYSMARPKVMANKLYYGYIRAAANQL